MTRSNSVLALFRSSPESFDVTEFLVWSLGVPAAIAASMLLAVLLEWAVWQVQCVSAHCHSRLNGWRARVAENSFRREQQKGFLDWLAAQTGTALQTGSVDQTLVEAQQQTELIRILTEQELPKAVLRCVDTHRLTAKVTGTGEVYQPGHTARLRQT